MSIIFYILIFLFTCIGMTQAGTWFINALVRLWLLLKWKKFIISLILIAVFASLPELFVGISAALSFKPELAFGTVIGTNIILLTIVSGLMVFSGKELNLKGKALKKTLLFAIFYSFLPLILLLDGEVSRVDGFVLLAAFGLYAKEFLFQQAQMKERFIENPPLSSQSKKTFFKNIVQIIVSAIVLAIGAQVIIFSATRISLYFGMPLVLMGTIGVALCVSLPKIIFKNKFNLKKEKETIPGMILCPMVINSTLVLGLVFLISPIRQIYELPLYINSLIFTGLAVLALLIFSKTGEKVTRKEAKLLLLLYFLFFIIQLAIWA